MNTLVPKSGEKIKNVHLTDDTISARLFDGRTISCPSCMVSTFTACNSFATRKLENCWRRIWNTLA